MFHFASSLCYYFLHYSICSFIFKEFFSQLPAIFTICHCFQAPVTIAPKVDDPAQIRNVRNAPFTPDPVPAPEKMVSSIRIPQYILPSIIPHRYLFLSAVFPI